MCKKLREDVKMDLKENEKQKTKVFFNLEKDLWLLKEVLSLNPYQLGSEKWKDVVANLKVIYGLSISIRTAKDRVNNLISKLLKEELASRTGTEQQQDERDIISIIEETVSLFTDENHWEADVTQPSTSKDNHRSNKKLEILEANIERDSAAEQKYRKDSPITSQNRRKRKVPFEEEMILQKQLKQYDLEDKSLEYKHEERMKELAIEKRHLEADAASKEMMKSTFSFMKNNYEKFSDDN